MDQDSEKFWTDRARESAEPSKPAEMPPKRFERCPDCGSPFPDFECSGLNHHILTRRAGMIIAECPNQFHAGFPDHFGKTKVIANAR